MRMRTVTILLLFICLTGKTGLFSQSEIKADSVLAAGKDTTASRQTSIGQMKEAPATLPSCQGKIYLDRDASLKYLLGIYSSSREWKTTADPLREAIGVLIYNASRPPMDSTARFLLNYEYDSIRVPVEDPYLPDSVRIIQPVVSDSIEAAVRSLAGFLEARDSTLLKIVSETGRSADVWLNSRGDNLIRFWLPDGQNDSVTVWVGSPSRNVISLKTEEGVIFKKHQWRDRYADTRVNIINANDEDLRKVTMNKVRPDYWRSRGDLSYLLSQGSVSNWAKGGENNISTVLDVTGYLDYNNKVTKITSSTTGRFALGIMASGKTGIRKNLDVLEINSKLNHKAFGKFDFSGVFQFKTQSLPGYNYPNDSVKVSKFFNPATIILGYGLDYKPNKNLSINCSPLSYKGIFVPDTAMINQTKYGVPADRRSKNEFGAYVTINSTSKLFDKVNVTNRVQFFSNFISKPQNVDVDWEVIMTTSLNWFTDLRVNAHLIYDDNTLLPVYGRDDKPVMGSDGVQKKSPRVQFKELLGVSFVFRF